MRRLCALVLVVLAGFVGFTIATGTRADSASTYRVDAIFDTAKGIIPGQVVKIAGARVGGIEDVALTRDYKARIEMSVPRRFVFHKDASCNIQPEGLISENFVQCEPGTPGTPQLGGAGDSGTPTVPVQHTMVPVSITDLFRIFQADIRQRFTVAIAAVGGGLAARGSELNDILHRSNPTLMAVQRLTHDLSHQTQQLNAAVRDTDRVIGALAQRKGAVQDFIVQAAHVTQQTAAHRTQLADAVRRLPGLLDRTDSVIGNLVRLTRDGRPLLGQLRAATPGVTRVVNDLSPFAHAGVPALRRLSHTADIARPTIRAATPVVARLRTFARYALPVGRTLNTLLLDLRARGFVESLNSFSYYAAAATARYDSISHMLPAHSLLTTCSGYAQAPAAGCNAFYYGPSAAGTRAHRHRAAHQHARHEGSPAGTPAATPAAPQATPTVPDALKPVQDLTQQLSDTLKQALPANGQTLNDLADFLFRK
jgi:virulence factor Mce-like protein